MFNVSLDDCPQFARPKKDYKTPEIIEKDPYHGFR